MENSLAALRVLVIDDEPAICESVVLVLDETGVSHVTLVADGKEALDMLETRADPFGLVVCDWMMPGMDGLEFPTKFRALHPDTPFVMLTAKTESKNFRGCP